MIKSVAGKPCATAAYEATVPILSSPEQRGARVPSGKAFANTISRALDRASTPDFLTGGGEMGALMRAHDWSTPPSATRAPGRNPFAQPCGSCSILAIRCMSGGARTWRCLYNDAYRRSIGSERHPGSLGRPGSRGMGGDLGHHWPTDRAGDVRARCDLATKTSLCRSHGMADVRTSTGPIATGRSMTRRRRTGLAVSSSFAPKRRSRCSLSNVSPRRPNGSGACSNALRASSPF